MGESLVLDRPAPPVAVELDVPQLAELAGQQATDVLLDACQPMHENSRSRLALDLGAAVLTVAGVKIAEVVSPEAVAAAQARNEAVNRRAANLPTQERAPNPERHSLTELLSRIRLGDETAHNLLAANVTAELSELVCKSGAVMESKTFMSEQGELTQFGSTTEQRQENTLRTFTYNSSGLREMTQAEGQSGFTIEELYRRGLLGGKVVVEISLIPDEDRKALVGSGLFLREAIGVIRTTRVFKNGECTIQSVLVAGTDQDALPSFTSHMTPDDEARIEEQALYNRFDLQVVRRMFELWGVPNAQHLTPGQILATTLVMPDAVDGLDVAMLFDQLAGEITGKPLMMGLPRLYRDQDVQGPLSRRHYEEHAQRSQDLQAELKYLAQGVLFEFISRADEAEGDDYKAGRLLHKIATDCAVQYIGDYRMANADIFGLETYQLLARREEMLAQGDTHGAQKTLQWAKDNAKGTGCPTGAERTDKTDGKSDSEMGSQSSSDNGSEGKGSTPPKQIRCIKCRKYSPREKVVHLNAQEPKKSYWGCPHCRYKIDVCTGNELHPSDIDSKDKDAGQFWEHVLALAGQDDRRAKALDN